MAVALAAVVAVTLAVTVTAAGGSQCAVHEWGCRGGGCVRLDRYCDGAPHCADGSDEPRHCSPCNRTYYGLQGVEYGLRLPASPKVPFLCQLTFTAGGQALGDLVQITFDEFRVGRFIGGASEPCPDGFLTLAELGRPFTGGAWCGAADGPAAYYSETRTVTASLKLAVARLGEPLGLSLRYRFLSAREAVVRFGPAEAPLERGAVAPGTYCTRTFDECHRRPCRLQSPNYPGLYPRNVSCYWSLRQRAVPTCKHAMLSIRQPHAHKMQIKRSIAPASMNKTGVGVRAWGQCGGSRDRLIVYDGGSTDDPVLLEYCGGAWLPPVTARGPEMLVAFHASPRPAPPRAAPRAALRGFELDVDVIFADSDSLDYAREARRCEFHVKASSGEEELNGTAGAVGAVGTVGAGRGRRGALRAPRHSLPPGALCSWTFHGRPGDIVWIYFSSFTSYSLAESRRGDSGERDEDSERPRVLPSGGGGGYYEREECAVELRLWEGEASSPPGPGAAGAGPLPLVVCDAAPVLCARASLANATRQPRPCAPPDGLLTAGPLLALTVRTRPGTAVHPLGFLLHYEFLDTRLDGEPWEAARAEPRQCARLVTRPGAVRSPSNALWFGRGGAASLRCVYRLRAAGGAGARLQLEGAAFGRGAARCGTRPDPLTGRPACWPLGPEASPPDAALAAPHLLLWESPWEGLRVPLGCVCDAAAAENLSLSGAALELELVGPVLDPLEDHRHLHWRGSWQPLPLPAPLHCAQRRQRPPPGEHLHLVYPYSLESESECGATPFLLRARGNRSLAVRLGGRELATPPPGAEPPPCRTANRLLLYDAETSRLVKAVCPSVEDEEGGEGEVRVVWSGGGLALVWLAVEPGRARAHWMEAWRPATDAEQPGAGDPCAPSGRLCGQLGMGAAPGSSAGGCMPPELWCDGRADCPGGADERLGCGAHQRLLAALRRHSRAAGGLAGAAAALALGAVLVLCRRRRKPPPLLASRASSAAS